MADLRIDEEFELPASPERVWELLVAPEKIVGCLPGASLDEKVDDDTYRGAMTVKLGAVTVVYRGEVVFEETDAEARTLRMSGTGRERTGSGSARMTMTSRIEPLEGGGSRTTVGADVQISGKMVRFGRGMIQRVTHEIFKEFTACLAEKVGEDGPAEDAPAKEESEQEPAGGDGAGASASAGPAERKGGAEEGDAARAAGSRAEAKEKEGSEGGAAERTAGEEGSADTSLRLGPVLWKAFVGWLGELWGRIRG